MKTNCENCKYWSKPFNESPCEKCDLDDNLWEPGEQEVKIKWRPVTEPPTEPIIVLLTFCESTFLSEGQYLPKDGGWNIFDDDMTEFTPEFYIQVEDLHIPPHQ